MGLSDKLVFVLCIWKMMDNSNCSTHCDFCIFLFVFFLLLVPGAPPRRVEVEVLNSTALKVMWRSLTPGKQNGQIRGYQVHYVRVENGESRGLPLIKDVMLADAQVWRSHSFPIFFF